jgi:hypothetical protein
MMINYANGKEEQAFIDLIGFKRTLFLSLRKKKGVSKSNDTTSNTSKNQVPLRAKATRCALMWFLQI